MSNELLLTEIRQEICCVCVHKATSIENGLSKDSPKTLRGTGCTYGYDEESGLYCQLAIKCANHILAKVKQQIRADLEPLMAEALDISDWSFVQEYIRSLSEV